MVSPPLPHKSVTDINFGRSPAAVTEGYVKRKRLYLLLYALNPINGKKGHMPPPRVLCTQYGGVPFQKFLTIVSLSRDVFMPTFIVPLAYIQTYTVAWEEDG